MMDDEDEGNKHKWNIRICQELEQYWMSRNQRFRCIYPCPPNHEVCQFVGSFEDWKEHFSKHTCRYNYQCMVCKEMFFAKEASRNHMCIAKEEDIMKLNVSPELVERDLLLRYRFMICATNQKFAAPMDSNWNGSCLPVHSDDSEPPPPLDIRKILARLSSNKHRRSEESESVESSSLPPPGLLELQLTDRKRMENNTNQLKRRHEETSTPEQHEPIADVYQRRQEALRKSGKYRTEPADSKTSNQPLNIVRSNPLSISPSAKENRVDLVRIQNLADVDQSTREQKSSSKMKIQRTIDPPEVPYQRDTTKMILDDFSIPPPSIIRSQAELYSPLETLQWPEELPITDHGIRSTATYQEMYHFPIFMDTLPTNQPCISDLNMPQPVSVMRLQNERETPLEACSQTSHNQANKKIETQKLQRIPKVNEDTNSRAAGPNQPIKTVPNAVESPRPSSLATKHVESSVVQKVDESRQTGHTQVANSGSSMKTSTGASNPAAVPVSKTSLVSIKPEPLDAEPDIPDTPVPSSSNIQHASTPPTSQKEQMVEPSSSSATSIPIEAPVTKTGLLSSIKPEPQEAEPDQPDMPLPSVSGAQINQRGRLDQRPKAIIPPDCGEKFINQQKPGEIPVRSHSHAGINLKQPESSPKQQEVRQHQAHKAEKGQDATVKSKARKKESKQCETIPQKPFILPKSEPKDTDPELQDAWTETRGNVKLGISDAESHRSSELSSESSQHRQDSYRTANMSLGTDRNRDQQLHSSPSNRVLRVSGPGRNLIIRLRTSSTERVLPHDRRKS